MTIRNIIDILVSQGRKITWRQRKDGGILITKIDSKAFSGAKGNIMARQLTGQELSTARSLQLSKITQERIINKDLYSYYRKVKKKWKSTKRTAGEITWKKVKWQMKDNPKEVMRYLLEKEKYASGIAYYEVVEALAQYIEDYAQRKESPELQDLADEVRANADNIKDEWIYPAYQELYELDHGIPVKDVINNVKRILRI